MEYTREEIKAIKNNIKAIENYCKNEIVPLINGDSIFVDFSETQYRTDGSAFKKHYGFGVSKEYPPAFTSSALHLVIDENYERKEGSVNAYEHWCYMLELLDRWQIVKTKLLNKIQEENEYKSKILNFEI